MLLYCQFFIIQVCAYFLRNSTFISIICNAAMCLCAGKYFADCKEQATLLKGTDEVVAERLWKLSEKLVQTSCQ